LTRLERGTGAGPSRREFARMLALGGPAALWARAALARAPVDARPLPPEPIAHDESYWEAVRAQFPLPREVAALNAANLCPSPRPVIEALYNDSDLDHDLSPANRRRMHEGKEATRARLAAFLRVTPDEIVLTRNTSEANNLVSSGLDLGPGDEVVVFSDNHASNREAWREKARRRAYTVREMQVVQPHPGEDHYLEAADRALTSRVRLLAFTHLTNSVGDLFPAAELCRLARGRGVLTLVDGAQSFGLMDLDLGRMQPDFYSGSAHKWLCGPKEAGVLYVRRDVQDRLWPSIVSLYPGETGLSRTFEGFGQRDEPALAAFGAAADFQVRIGRPAIERRARELAAAFKEGLRGLPGVRLWTHPDPARSHAVVSFQPGGLDPEKLALALYDSDRIVCAARTGADRPGLRFSPHFFNLHAEVERALAALRRTLARGL